MIISIVYASEELNQNNLAREAEIDEYMYLLGLGPATGPKDQNIRYIEYYGPLTYNEAMDCLLQLKENFPYLLQTVIGHVGPHTHMCMSLLADK